MGGREMMKKTMLILLVLTLVLGSQMPVSAESEGTVRYETETLKIADSTNQVSTLNATLTLPNYLGSVEAVLETVQGTANATVQVVYLPNDKWDDQCYYSAMSARIRRYGAWLFTGSTQIVGWKDLYSYGFLPVDGGTAVFTPDSAELHFLEGPGLYTALVSLPYSMENTGYTYYSEAQTQAPGSLQYTGIGFPFVLVLNDDSIAHFLEHGTLDTAAAYTWPGLRELILEAQYEELPEVEVEGLHNFQQKVPFTKGMFLDMPYNETAWYDSYVEKVVRIGLMKGSSGGQFLPNGDVKLSEVIAMAARLHNIYMGGTGDFYQGPVWYNVYVSYALANGIIRDGDFADYDRTATRGEMAYILGSAVPAKALEQINTVGELPDVNAATPYSYKIFALYQAGVLTGYSDHSYHPDATITRCETAAIIARIADASLRQTF
jgi:hypothetical protein